MTSQSMVAVVVGSTGGIGNSVCLLMLEKGFKVIGLSRRCLTVRWKEGSKICEQIEPSVKLDINNDASILTSYKYVKSIVNHIDALILCAGQAYGALIGLVQRDALKECIDTNLVSPIMLIQAYSRLLKKSLNGAVVSISSISAFRDDIGTVGYGSAKAGLNQATKIIAREFGRYNIRVNAIAPGITDTSMLSLMDEKSLNMQIDSSINKKCARPEQIAELVFFLVSKNSEHINGQVIKIDGGQGC